MTQSELPPKLRPSQASKATGVSRETLRRWEHEKPGFPAPARPTQRCTLYDRDRLLAFIEANGEAVQQ